MMQRSNYYDDRILDNIQSVLVLMKESVSDKVWQERVIVCENARKQFLANIETFKNKLHAIIDAYLLEKKQYKQAKIEEARAKTEYCKQCILI